MLDNESHEIYPGAPVALVAVEIIFPSEMVVSPLPPAVGRALGEVLGDPWVAEQVPQGPPTFNVFGVPAGTPPPQVLQGFPILRFADRDRGASVALTSGSVTIQTTRYGNWPGFRSTLETVLRATERLVGPAGVTRTGLRYIDEIRVPEQPGAGWGQWLSPTVLAPVGQAMSDAGWPPTNWTGTSQYQIGEDRHLVLRFGPQPAQPGFIVNPDGPLWRPGPRPQGSFFLLDFDAFWQPAGIPRWDSEHLLETCDQLRRPIRMLFDHIVNERLVEEVFKHKEAKQ